MRRRRRAPARSRCSAAAAGGPENCEVVELLATDLCEGDDAGSSSGSGSGAAAGASAPAAAAEGALTAPLTPLDLFLRSLDFNARMVKLLLPYVPVKLESTLLDLRGEAFDPKGPLQEKWHKAHEQGARNMSTLIQDLKGFHVKAGQTIATRTDLFPREYSLELAYLVDSVNPLPFSIVRHVVEQDLLGGLPLEDAFESFNEEPLGSASIAQVHEARLNGGRRVAVKVQRPNAEVQLMKDVGDIRGFSKWTRDIFPLDYYTVFTEIERQMQTEFDFRLEASGMDRVANALRRHGRKPPVHVPRSIPGLVSRTVLCMDYVPGVPLSNLKAELKRRGIDIEPGSRAEIAFGRKLLRALSDAFAVMIFDEGFFHADPHPGNVFVMPDLSVALIDFGQSKQIGYRFRRELAEIIVALSDCGDTEEEFHRVAKLLPRMGTEFLPSAHPLCGVALSLWLFDTSRTELPGGYVANELSPKCPARDCAAFDPDFVLVCRTTLLIRGLAARLGVNWSLTKAWREHALATLRGEPVAGAGGPDKAPGSSTPSRLLSRLLSPWRRSSREAVG